jgi:hypothetical protein
MPCRKRFSEPHNDGIGFRIDVSHLLHLLCFLFLVILVNAQCINPEPPRFGLLQLFHCRGYVARYLQRRPIQDQRFAIIIVPRIGERLVWWGIFHIENVNPKKRCGLRGTAEPGRLEGDGSQFVPALNQNESDKEDRARSGIDISGPVMYVFRQAFLTKPQH